MKSIYRYINEKLIINKKTRQIKSYPKLKNISKEELKELIDYSSEDENRLMICQLIQEWLTLDIYPQLKQRTYIHLTNDMSLQLSNYYKDGDECSIVQMNIVYKDKENKFYNWRYEDLGSDVEKNFLLNKFKKDYNGWNTYLYNSKVKNILNKKFEDNEFNEIIDIYLHELV